jgi:hypothetical protein
LTPDYVARLIAPVLGPFGLLVPGLIGAAFIAQGLGALTFRTQSSRQRVLGGLVLTLAIFTGGLQLLLYAGALRPRVILVLFPALMVGVELAQRMVTRRAGAVRAASGAVATAESPGFRGPSIWSVRSWVRAARRDNSVL